MVKSLSKLCLELYEKEISEPRDEYVRVDAESLKKFISDIFIAAGIPERHADIVADVLVVADLMGISSHGVQRLGRYLGGIKVGSINKRPNIRIVKRFGATALVDADNGLGHVAGVFAMNEAIELALNHGIGFVLVRRSHHYGIAGYYSLMAVEKKMIGVSATNTEPLVAYINTTQRYLGTNPIAVGVPRKIPPPLLFDAAMSVVPVGRIEVYAKTNKKVPQGWVIHESGKILSGDSKKVLEDINMHRAAILPLGGASEDFGGHKGSGLALLVDIFSGVLSGAAWGYHVLYTIADRPANVGHLFSAINIETFMSLEEFYNRIEQMIFEIKSLKKAPWAERIWIPGEKAWLTMQTRLRIGIPIHINILKELESYSKEYGVPFTLKIISINSYSNTNTSC